MLKVFPVLGNQSRAYFGKFLPELRGDLGTNKIFYGLLRRGFRVNLDLKLSRSKRLNPLLMS